MEEIIKTILDIEKDALEKEKQGEIDLEQMESRRIVLLKKLKEQIENEKNEKIKSYRERLELEKEEEFSKIKKEAQFRKSSFEKRYEEIKDKIVEDAFEVVLRSMEGYDG